MNLRQIRIQNFRNLKDITISLDDVNLFIGPNNSGKSNVLHAIRLGSMIVQKNLHNPPKINYSTPISKDQYYKWLASTGSKIDTENCTLSFIFDLNNTHSIYLSCNANYIKTKICWGLTNKINTSLNLFEEVIIQKNDTFIYFEEPHIFRISKDSILPLSKGKSEIFLNLNYSQFKQSEIIEDCKNAIKDFANLPIYEISPREIRLPYGTTGDKFIEKDGSNIVSFLDYLKDNREDIYAKLKETLSLITKDFQGFRLDVLNNVPEEIRLQFPQDTIKRFGLIDSKSYENTIWAEHLSDGILYFLALLCVVNQPYPPPILLLEEPEKGIHPRRIREVMDLLFSLANEKKIQIILTTHSTFVLDEFTDSPESVTVFDNNDGLITVKNLKNDILKNINDSLEDHNYPKDYLEHSLGDNWALGLLGGVPN